MQACGKARTLDWPRLARNKEHTSLGDSAVHVRAARRLLWPREGHDKVVAAHNARIAKLITRDDREARRYAGDACTQPRAVGSARPCVGFCGKHAHLERRPHHVHCKTLGREWRATSHGQCIRAKRFKSHHSALTSAKLHLHEVRTRPLDDILARVRAVEQIGHTRRLPRTRGRCRCLAILSGDENGEHVRRFERARVAKRVARNEDESCWRAGSRLDKTYSKPRAMRG